MRKCVSILMMIVGLVAIWPLANVCADVVIKVRALNPLNTRETAVINYPLPQEIAKEDIIRQKILYSFDHSEDEEPPKTEFEISRNEKTGAYFIDDEVVLAPKEIVTLEVHVKDIWIIQKEKIEDLRTQIDGLLDEWEKQLGNQAQTDSEEKNQEEETKEFALMMKQEILDNLDKILERQNENSILNVGVERHISAYNENIEDLQQVEQDIVLLANLIQFDAEEEGEGGESQEDQPFEEEEPLPEEIAPQDTEALEDAITDENALDEVVSEERVQE